MEKRLILCEGKTDAILLSYYLKHILCCRYAQNRNRKFPDLDRIGLTEWYIDDKGALAIIAIQGHTFLHACAGKRRIRNLYCRHVAKR